MEIYSHFLAKKQIPKKAMATPEIEDFLVGPLVTWFTTCLVDPNTSAKYADLVDGVLVHNVFLQINPEPSHDNVSPSCDHPSLRTKNLRMIVKNIKQFYEEELGHLILKLPDIESLGREPELHVRDMELLLILLLGCAVQCPNKKNFITKIKTLPMDTQMLIVEYIKQVTDSHEIVITQEALENANMAGIFKEIKKLIEERDTYKEKWRCVTITDLSGSSAIDSDRKHLRHSSASKSGGGEEHHHFAVELADWKSKVRKQRQELEEKTEALLECKEELEYSRQTLLKLRQENQELSHEARSAKTYRDELDAMIERADRADRLELEVERYREKLNDIEFYKTRLTEMREEYRIGHETQELLEDQLIQSRRRSDKILELEKEILGYKQTLNDIALEREVDREKYEELLDENRELQRLKKAADAHAARVTSEIEMPICDDKRLSEQLSHNAQTRALKLELENRRLTILVESLRENAFYETSNRLLEVEKEKKKLSLKVESLTNNNERLTQQNVDLELLCQQTLEENRKMQDTLQDTLQNQRTSAERQQQDYQAQQDKIGELEKNYETAIKEKQRIQLLLESVQRRADELERSLESSKQKLEDIRQLEEKVREAETRCADLELQVASLEKDKETAMRDVHKCRELIEDKDVALDQAHNEIDVMTKKIEVLEREVEASLLQIMRLQEVERCSKEMDTRAAIDKETMQTLQANLVAEKMTTQQMQTALEKLGLTVESLLSLSTENFVERLINVPEMSQYINKLIMNIENEHKSLEASESKEAGAEQNGPQNKDLQELVETLKKELEGSQGKLNTCQIAMENLLEEQAKSQVLVTTLQSSITSLNAQHMALQLANSQLVAEKEELLKQQDVQKRIHDQLLVDQVTLQSLHEQLTNEYEGLLEERESLKATFRDAKNHFRSVKEEHDQLEIKNKQLIMEKETTLATIKSLNNLRGEHSKLKDDFRNLYTASEKLKIEYKNLQEDYRKNKIETNRMRLKLTQLQGDMSVKDEHSSMLELQISKLNQRCEMLIQMNSGLDSNRKSLMEHVSVLLNQYHDLLSHSLDDKEHYHSEEKLYRDQVNHLSRQKEKLEEKIMEYYKNKQSCSTKKKRFGAGLVKKVRKASSELLNKNKQSWGDDAKQSDSKLYESESGGNDTDASVDEHRVIDEATVSLDSETFSLGTPGTRRTLYYTDEPSSPATSLPPEQKLEVSPQSSADDGQSSRTTQEQNSRPFLIYNKVSAVINESKTITTPVDEQTNEERDEQISTKETKAGNSVWYEYGCV